MGTPDNVRDYKDLLVWQKSMQLVELVYLWTQQFPTEERYGLSSQMRRAAVSIPSNIAEGRRRNSRKDFASFVDIAFGSASELETQALIAEKLQYGSWEEFTKCMGLLDEISKMLWSLRRSLRTQDTNPRHSRY